MDKYSFYFISILILCFGLFWGYSNEYSITDDRIQLEANIEKFINRSERNEKQIEFKQSINIDNRKYILYVSQGYLGLAELTKGLNNKYKTTFTEYASASFIDRIYETNKAKYLIIIGRKHQLKINYVKVLLDNKEYRIDIPQQEYFLVYCKVPNETEAIFPDIKNIKLYDKNNVDITDELLEILLD